MSRRVAQLVVAVGVGLAVAGVALVSVPLALLGAGMAVVLFGLTAEYKR